MGYDVHITRKEFWSDPEGPRIERNEWEGYVSSDKDVFSDPNNGDDDFLIKLASIEQPAWYDSELGEIYTKNPSKEVMTKLWVIAEALSASVLGDDDEKYGANGELVQNLELQELLDRPSAKKKFWQVWKKS